MLHRSICIQKRISETTGSGLELPCFRHLILWYVSVCYWKYLYG